MKRLDSQNTDIDVAREFHESTKHSEISIRTSGHYLDWGNKPKQFKVYKNLEMIPLPRKFPLPEFPTLSAIAGSIPGDKRKEKIDLHDLAEILFFSGGITRKLHVGGEVHYMRAASATGALYPIELYIVAGSSIEGLDTGVYHFDPLGFSLTCLRKGDYRALLAQSSNKDVASKPITIILSSVAWKNAWKYQLRSYRHWYWDGGVIVANLLATASATGLSAKVVNGFIDETVNRLLGLEHGKEAAICIVPLGAKYPSQPSYPIKQITNLHLETEPLSNEETDYPEMWNLHKASSLNSRSELDNWLSDSPRNTRTTPPSGRLISTAIPTPRIDRTLSDTILQRGSTRKFARMPMSFEQLTTVLMYSHAQIPVDYSPCTPWAPSLDIFFIANQVNDVSTGSYQYQFEKAAIEQLQSADSRRASMYLSLEQPLFADASVVLFMMADLHEYFSRFGNRGYRVAQLEGGIMAGRAYLAAYALGLGASGSTFYDDAVTEFFGPAATGKSPIIEVAVGIPGYKAKKGQILPQFS